jgi:hypothetical protein
MKYMRISESFMWVFLVLGACAGAAMIGWQAHTDWNLLPVAEQRAVLEISEVETIAKTFLETHFSLNLEAFEKATILASEALPDTFINQSYLSEAERIVYKDNIWVQQGYTMSAISILNKLKNIT